MTPFATAQDQTNALVASVVKWLASYTPRTLNKLQASVTAGTPLHIARLEKYRETVAAEVPDLITSANLATELDSIAATPVAPAEPVIDPATGLPVVAA